MNNIPSRELVQHYKETYKKGLRVKFIYTNDPYSRLESGEKGTIEFVDSIGTVHIRWDSGSGLGMIPGEDQFEIISE